LFLGHRRLARATKSRLDLEMTNVTLSITGLLSTDAHPTALSDTYVA